MKDCYEKHDFKEKFIYRIKCNLLFPTHTGRKHLPPHTDYQKGKHSVILYYVNDSDGDTFLFNDDMTVRERVSPKKNRALYFDGSITHAASNPKNSDAENFVVQIHLNKPVKNIEISSDIINTKIPDFQFDEKNYMLYLFIEDLGQGQSRSLLVDFDNYNE